MNVRALPAAMAATGEKGVDIAVTRRHSTRLDMEARGLDEMVRASVHYYNIEDEIDRLCRVLRGS